MCVCGNFHPGIFEQVSTTNADAHLVRLFLASEVKEGQDLVSADVRNAFLNAEMSNSVLILMRPPSELVKMGIVGANTTWVCRKACYGLKEAPKMWEEHRDKVLGDLSWELNKKKFHLVQSIVHPSLWYIMKGPPLTSTPIDRYVPDGKQPYSADWLQGDRVGALLVYVDDILGAGPRKILTSFLDAVRQKWDLATPEYLGQQEGDVDSLRFLGMDIEQGREENTWVIHQQAFTLEVLERVCPSLLLRRMSVPGQPESFGQQQTIEKEQGTSKSDRLDLSEEATLPSLVGSLLWLSLRTRPDIAWAVSRIASLATEHPLEAWRRVKHVLQYLRWTLDFGMVFTPHNDHHLYCFTDASLSPTGERSHQGIAIYWGPNLIAWQSNRQSLVATSSAEAELIACVAGAQLSQALQVQLGEYHQQSIPLSLRCDNSAVIQLVHHLSSSSTRTRHLAMRAAWLHDLVSRQHLSLEFVSSGDQKADSLTKGLSAALNSKAQCHFCLGKIRE